MALNIAGMQQNSNIAGNFQQGLQFGQMQKERERQLADQQQLRTLAPQVIAGDPGATAQAAVIDPDAAGKYQGAGDGIARRAEGLVRLLEEADKRDPREAQALWQAHGVPFARQFSNGTEPTTDWAQAKPMLASLKARIEMAKSAQNPVADPTGYREAHMKAIAAGYQPGSDDYKRAMRVSLGTEAGLARTQPKTITTDINGVPTTLTFDPGTQSYRIAEITGSSQPSPTRQVIGPDGRPLDLSGITDQRMRDEIESNPALWQVAPDGAEVRMQEQGPPAGVPILGRTKEAEAAAVEAAKQGSALQFLPEQKRIETAAAIEQARGVETAKTEAERTAQAPKRIKQYETALQASQNVMTSIDKALEMIGPMSTGFIGARSRRIEGSPAYNLAAEIETVKANLGFDRLQQMRDNSPTGGALGAIAVQELVALQSTIANLDPNQSDEQLKQNLERVQTHYRNWQTAVRQALADEQRQPAGSRTPQQGRATLPAGFSWED